MSNMMDEYILPCTVNVLSEYDDDFIIIIMNSIRKGVNEKQAVAHNGGIVMGRLVRFK